MPCRISSEETDFGLSSRRTEEDTGKLVVYAYFLSLVCKSHSFPWWDNYFCLTIFCFITREQMLTNFFGWNIGRSCGWNYCLLFFSFFIFSFFFSSLFLHYFSATWSRCLVVAWHRVYPDNPQSYTSGEEFYSWLVQPHGKVERSTPVLHVESWGLRPTMEQIKPKGRPRQMKRQYIRGNWCH